MAPTKRERVADTPERDKLSEAELEIVERFFKRAKTVAPRMKLGHNDHRVAVDHRNPLIGQLSLMEALGTADLDFYDGLMSQLIDAARAEDGQPSEQELNFLLSVLKGVKPKDQLEAMLAAQMAAVHAAAMRSVSALKRSDTADSIDCLERASNKLCRTFTSQMEALKRYRAHDEHNVTVQNVSVNEGGQAIVGNVNQAHRTNPTKMAPSSARTRAQEHERVNHSPDRVSLVTDNQVVPIRRVPPNAG